MSGLFYIASSRDGLPDVQRVAAYLESNGWQNAFAWHAHFMHRCSPSTCDIPNRFSLARRELNAAGDCDLFIGIARLGKGSHVELGAALTGRGKRTILVGVDRADSVFYDAEDVEHVADVDALIRLLDGAKS